MADSLADLQQTAQGQTLGGIQNNTGAAPTTIGTAQSLGASQNASQMVGTPQQSAAAIKEAMSPKNTLSELMRTATGRVQAKKGQSETALQGLESAKALSGLAGKLGEATTRAVSNASVALDVAANIADIPGKTDAEKAALSGDLKNLVDTLNTPGADVMPAYKSLKEKGYTDQQIAGFFNVEPEVLWGKVSSQLPKNVLVKDMIGVAPQAQLDSVRNMLSQDELTKFDNMTWDEAKQLVNQKLNDSVSNVAELKKQAIDRTLPASTRALAVQRLRELGQTGEYQAADEIKTAQQVVEEADNVYIDGQAYEVSEVLQAPEAKALITDILTGAKDVTALKGTPFEGMADLITQRSEKLAEYFGIDKGQLGGVGRIQEIEKTRAANEASLTNFFRDKGLTPTTDTNVLKALGITEDMQKGYAAFDQNAVNNNPVLNTVLTIKDATARAGAVQALAIQGADKVINDPQYQGLVDLLNPAAESGMTPAEGQALFGQLVRANNIMPSKAVDTMTTQEQSNFVNTFFKEAGISDILDTFGKYDFDDTNQKLPEQLDSDKDGKLDSPDKIAQQIESGNLDMNKLREFRQQMDSIDLNKAVQQKSVDESVMSTMPKLQTQQDFTKAYESMPALKALGGFFHFNKDGSFKGPAIWNMPATADKWENITATRGKIQSLESEIQKLLSTAKNASPTVKAQLQSNFAPLMKAVTDTRAWLDKRTTQLAALDKANNEAAAAARQAEIERRARQTYKAKKTRDR